MLKAYRYRIYPNKEQEIQLAKTFGCCRFVYNQTLLKYILHPFILLSSIKISIL